MNKLHPLQNQILRNLMFSTGLRYTEMKPDKEMENNQFQFHLDQLIKNEFVTKDGDSYKLTERGKQYVKVVDNQTGEIIKQPHISVRAACIRKNGKENEYLFYTRHKHPYYGCQGFPAGKLQHGEIISEALLRELREETGLSGKPELVAVTHYLDINKKGDCLTDKIMFLFVVKDTTGELVSSEEGEYEWVKRSEVVLKITKPFENIEGVLSELEMIDDFGGKIKFIEKTNEVEDKF
jgi:8-oxo-dGTP diphosphatase